MKFALALLLLSGPALAASGLPKLPGRYVSDDGATFVVKRAGNAITLQTNAELSRYGLCRAPLTLTTTRLDDGDDYAEARFATSPACARTDGPITLHYNRALTGVDVYLVDVVVRAAHGRDRGLTMRWHLRKTN